jgi:hypothetical protein
LVKNIFVGIDPGTTTGVAIISLDSKIIDVYSKRNYGTNTLIKDLTSYGKPLVFATDKKNIPSFIQNLAAKLGAKIYSPQTDLLKKEKKETVDSFSHRTYNDHESDALACVLIAFKEYKPLLDKIQKQIDHTKKKLLKSKVQSLVIKENLGISLALELLTQPKDEDTQIVKKLIKEEKLDVNYIKLLNKIKDREASIINLKKTINKMRNEAKKQKITARSDHHKEKRDQTSRLITYRLKESYDIIKDLKAELKKIEKVLWNNPDIIVLKKYNPSIKIKGQFTKGDYVIAKDIKGKNLDELKEITGNIIKSVSKSDVLYETKGIILINKKDLPKKPSNLIESVLDDYKRSRNR